MVSAKNSCARSFRLRPEVWGTGKAGSRLLALPEKEEKLMARIPIALQLYSVREDCKKDLPGVLAAVAKMGYDGVEFAGYYERSARELRKMLDDLGLKAAGTHIGLEALLGEAFPRTVEFNQTIGNQFLIVPGLDRARTGSRNAWLDTAKVFNEIADKLRPLNLYTGYHNHHTEFAPLDGEMPWDTFFKNTRPEVVMQIDLGNCLHGKADPVPLLERYPGRALSVHLKEYSATNPKALIGEGEVRWSDVFRICETTGKTKWYVVEQESYAHPPLECVERCLKNLKGMGK
jgi:sugar phosphate isomerase/epimerase